MRTLVIAVALVVMGGIGNAAPGTNVHVTLSAASGAVLDREAQTEKIRARFLRELAKAGLRGSTFDLVVNESMVTLARRQMEVTVELEMAISKRTGRIFSLVRTSATANGSVKSLAMLRDEATATAIAAAIERARAVR